jgi:hypothetical protein
VLKIPKKHSMTDMLGLFFILRSLLQMYQRNRFCRHTREGGYPEVFDFKEYWIPDNPEASGRE